MVRIAGGQMTALPVLSTVAAISWLTAVTSARAQMSPQRSAAQNIAAQEAQVAHKAASEYWACVKQGEAADLPAPMHCQGRATDYLQAELRPEVFDCLVATLCGQNLPVNTDALF
jgi:hypothetical protein